MPRPYTPRTRDYRRGYPHPDRLRRSTLPTKREGEEAPPLRFSTRQVGPVSTSPRISDHVLHPHPPHEPGGEADDRAKQRAGPSAFPPCQRTGQGADDKAAPPSKSGIFKQAHGIAEDSDLCQTLPLLPPATGCQGCRNRYDAPVRHRHQGPEPENHAPSATSPASAIRTHDPGVGRV